MNGLLLLCCENERVDLGVGLTVHERDSGRYGCVLVHRVVMKEFTSDLLGKVRATPEGGQTRESAFLLSTVQARRIVVMGRWEENEAGEDCSRSGTDDCV